MSRIKYLGNRISKQKHIHLAGDGNHNETSNEINEQQLIMEAIDDTLLTPQEKILKILKSMRLNAQGSDYLIYKDLGYCIKVVSSGELFNINLQHQSLIKNELKVRKNVI